MITTKELIYANKQRAANMRIFPNPVADAVVRRLSAPPARAHYENVSKITGVPWEVIAVIHQREASQSWKANIANGDPWNRPTIHVPKGRGPFKNWEAAAVDALTNCNPHAARWTDWSFAGACTLLEMYNGLGYANRKRPSPYIWSGTNQYQKGKYVSDGHYDPQAVDRQIGCAVLLAGLGFKGK